MNPITRAAKATFNFFVGDWIILFGVAIVLVAAWLLAHALPDAPFVGFLFFVGVAAVLAGTLSREIRP